MPFFWNSNSFRPVENPEPESSPRSIETLSGFDPASLERGVEAFKKLEMTKHPEKILQLLVEKEKTDQIRLKNECLKINASKKKSELKAKMLLECEKRKSDKNRTELERKLNADKSKIEENRIKTLMLKKEKLNSKWLAEQNSVFEKQQIMLRETEKLRAKNEKNAFERKALHELEQTKVREEAKTLGKIKRERENADILLKQTESRSRLKKEAKIQLLEKKLCFVQNYTDNLINSLSDPVKMTSLVASISMVIFSFFSCKYGLNVMGRYIDSRLGKPSLVRETSRWSFRHPLKTLPVGLENNRLLSFCFKSRKHQRLNSEAKCSSDVFEGIIMNSTVRRRLEWLVKATIATGTSRAPFQNVLLHGPPGTGKTMFSKSLAKNSGLHYAILTGGDFSQLGRDAVTELHRVLDWAERSVKGTLLFIDEADAVLRRGREGGRKNMSEHMRNVLSAFLYRTSAPSNKLMVVLATNLPHTLDEAVLDRMDETVHIPPPGNEERSEIFFFYLHRIRETLASAGSNALEEKSGLKAVCKKMAEKTNGFSGRAIEKMVVALQHSINSGQIKSTQSILKVEHIERELSRIIHCHKTTSLRKKHNFN